MNLYHAQVGMRLNPKTQWSILNAFPLSTSADQVSSLFPWGAKPKGTLGHCQKMQATICKLYGTDWKQCSLEISAPYSISKVVRNHSATKARQVRCQPKKTKTKPGIHSCLQCFGTFHFCCHSFITFSSLIDTLLALLDLVDNGHVVVLDELLLRLLCQISAWNEGSLRRERWQRPNPNQIKRQRNTLAVAVFSSTWPLTVHSSQ